MIWQNSQRWLLLERTSRRFLWFWLLLLFFYLNECFSFHCFSTPSFTLPWAIARFLHPFNTFSPAHRRVIRDTFILTFLGFLFLPRLLRFWVCISYPQALSTLHSFVCDSDVDKNTPFRIFLCACSHRVVLSSWRMALNYWCLNYKTIDLSIAPVSHKVLS